MLSSAWQFHLRQELNLHLWTLVYEPSLNPLRYSATYLNFGSNILTCIHWPHLVTVLRNGNHLLASDGLQTIRWKLWLETIFDSVLGRPRIYALDRWLRLRSISHTVNAHSCRWEIFSFHKCDLIHVIWTLPKKIYFSENRVCVQEQFYKDHQMHEALSTWGVWLIIIRRAWWLKSSTIHYSKKEVNMFGFKKRVLVGWNSRFQHKITKLMQKSYFCLFSFCNMQDGTWQLVDLKQESNWQLRILYARAHWVVGTTYRDHAPNFFLSDRK